jgi:chorismate mutase
VFVPAREETVVSSIDEAYENLFEKELKRIMKQENYENVSMIYRKIYEQRPKPEEISGLFALS